MQPVLLDLSPEVRRAPLQPLLSPSKHRRPRAPVFLSSKSTIWICFLAGVLSNYSVTFVGQLPVAEVVLLGVAAIGFLQLVFGKSRQRIPRARMFALLFFAQAIALVAYVISDLAHGSAPYDFVRGWFRLLLLAINFYAFAVTCGVNRGSLAAFQAGVGFSFVFLLVEPPLFGDWWKFGFAIPLTILVALLGGRRLGPIGLGLVFVALGGAHFMLGYRSLAVVCLATGILMPGYNAARGVRLCWFVAVILGTISLLPLAKQRMIDDATSGGLRSYVERVSMLEVASDAIIKHPLLGNGSWFSTTDVMERFLDIRRSRAMESGEDLGFDHESTEGVAIHSQILVALAEGGIFGAAFFLLYGVLMFRALWRLTVDLPYTKDAAWQLLVLVMALNAWLISPFSGPARIHIAFAAVLTLHILSAGSIDASRGHSSRPLRATFRPSFGSISGASRDTVGTKSR